MIDFYQKAGPMVIGSRLRRLSDTITEEAAGVYEFYGVPLEPKWFPVFYVLSGSDGLSVTEIARLIDHTHPSVSQIVKEMNRQGLTEANKSRTDGRIHVVRLTAKGRALMPQLEKQYLDVGGAVEDLLAEARHNLWKAMDEFEYQLSIKGLYARVREKYKERESRFVEICDYDDENQSDFMRLNLEWIEKYFEVEAADLVLLESPRQHILDGGGRIKLARLSGEIVGVCALVKKDVETFELAKMAVSETARGKGIGWMLGRAMIETCRSLGGRRIVIESNTRLEAAINLYHKLGFKKFIGPPSKYEKCNIQLELEVK